jgi:hypothetical protein
MGKIVLDRSAVAEEKCRPVNGSETLRCDAEGYDAATSGQSLATGSTIMVSVGLAAIAAGAVMFVLSPSGGAEKSAARARRYAVTPIVAPVGKSGAFVGISRAW